MPLARHIGRRPQRTVWCTSAPVACAGPLLHAELTALERALTGAQKPMMAVVGGSKVSTKLEVLDQLSKQCDSLVVGGGIANTFLAAAGYPVGQSLCEWDLIETARQLMDKVDIPLPLDVVVAPGIDEGHRARGEARRGSNGAGHDPGCWPGRRPLALQSAFSMRRPFYGTARSECLSTRPLHSGTQRAGRGYCIERRFFSGGWRRYAGGHRSVWRGRRGILYLHRRRRFSGVC